MKNPYDCSTCDDGDCIGCGESAYEDGYNAGIGEVVKWIEQNTTVNIPGTEDYTSGWQPKKKEWGLRE